MTITATSLPDTCTIQRRHAMQKLSYDGGSAALTVGQTLTGTTSHATGVIERISGVVASGYVILSSVSGTFQNNEALTDPLGGAAVADGVAADAKNDSEEIEGYYWVNDQVGVPCRFYSPRPGSAPTVDYGEGPEIPRKVMINPGATIAANEYRIVSIVTGFVGTFALAAPPEPRKFTFGIHHYEILLRKVKV